MNHQASKLKHVPHWFWLLGVVQWLGYVLLWFLLHLPQIGPGISASSGWYVVGSPYARWVAQQPVVAWLGTQPHVVGWLLVLCFGVVYGAYGAMLWELQRRRVQLRLPSLLLYVTVLALPLVFVPRMLSSDVYHYASLARIALVHGSNPFVDAPAQFPNDSLLSFVVWKTLPSVYGPLWIDLTLPLTGLAELLGGTAWAHVLVFKVFALACHLANTALIFRIVRQRRPGTEAWGMVLYGAHPLALIEFAGSGHNDGVMLLLVLLAVWYKLRQCRMLALVMLVLAGMIKLVGLLLVPLYALYILRNTGGYRRRALVLVGQVGIGLGIVAFLYAPWWVGWRTVESQVNAPALRIITNGPAASLVDKLEARLCSSRPSENCTTRIEASVGRASSVLFAVVYVVLALWPVRSFERWLNQMVWVLLASMLLAATQFQPWYGTWVLALVPLLVIPRWQLDLVGIRGNELHRHAEFLPRSRWLLVLGGCTLLLVYCIAPPLPGRIPLAFAPFALAVAIELLRFVVLRYVPVQPQPSAE